MPAISIGPSERSQSERESVSPARATQLEQHQAPQESEAAGHPTGDSEVISTSRSGATNEEQHAFLLDCFQRSPEQKQDAFKALKQQFKNVVSPQTYGRWWNSFLKSEYMLRQRGRPSERSSSARESASPAQSVQSADQHQAPQELEAAGDPTGDGELISAAVRQKELDEGIVLKCNECCQRIGMGIYENGCYCTDASAPVYHADELEARLKESGGKCPACGTQHPGFCILCQRLFKLQANGLRQIKVFLPCCDSYTHFECWYSPAPKQSCPSKCTKPWQGVQNTHYHQICDVKNAAPLHAVQKQRGIIGGRPLKNAKAASPTESIPSTVDTTTAAASEVSANESQALTYSHLMPPPSLAPRRSTRLSSRLPSIASNWPSPVATKPIAPVTHCCGTIQSAHFGYGCGSKKANHLPLYYNSLRDQVDTTHLPSLQCVAVAFRNNRTNRLFKVLRKRTCQLEGTLQSALCSASQIGQHPPKPGGAVQKLEGIAFSPRAEIQQQLGIREHQHYPKRRAHLHGQLFTIPPADARTRLGEISNEHSLNVQLMEALYSVLFANHKLAVVYEKAAETYR
ncbi:hypothetical protein niasHT_030055 [Heterodera trifolii]|uniref:Uncharacterized protein n=1 Tax=Heterodera trifolii TaxID=157864 RepID=A0ABD2JQG2_9BILA